MKNVKIAAISLSGVVAAAALAACSTPSPQSGTSQPTQPTPRVASNVHPYTAGAGTVTAVMPSPTSSAAGGTAQAMQRLEIKMDNGTVQYVETASKELTTGTRVFLTHDQLISKM